MTDDDKIAAAHALNQETLAQIHRLVLEHSKDETPRLNMIQARVDSIERVQLEHVRENGAQHADFGTRVGDLRSALYGNGTVGFVERLRNLEELAASIKGWGRWLKVGVAGLIMKALWDLIVQASQ
jgi:hypothetical protein